MSECPNIRTIRWMEVIIRDPDAAQRVYTLIQIGCHAEAIESMAVGRLRPRWRDISLYENAYVLAQDAIKADKAQMRLPFEESDD